MPKCSYIKKKKRNVCIGDMIDEVVIQTRNIRPPAIDGVDFSEEFNGKATVWALVNTVNGETIFDGSGTERDVTHHVYIRYIEGVTSEDWILFNNERLDILPVENLDVRSEFMLLKCSNLGTINNLANEL